MRGLAILMVVLYHATLWSGMRLVYPRWPKEPVVSLQTFASTGFLGVELFFFISGFVLFYPFARHVFEGTRKPGWLEYTYRRFIKIVPSYLFALTAAALIHQTDFATFEEFERQFAAHAFFLHGFSESTFVTIDAVFWSLAVEVQFYVVFPLLVLAFVRWPIATWAAVASSAFLYRQYHIADGSFENFLVNKGLPGEIDVFVTGMLGAYLFVRGRDFFAASRKARSWATVAAVAALVGVGFLFQSLVNLHPHGAYGNPDAFRDELRWQAQFRSVIIVLYLTLALGSAFALTFWKRIVANPVLVWLSVISYNLYLWHETLLTVCFRNGFPCALDPKPWLSSLSSRCTPHRQCRETTTRH